MIELWIIAAGCCVTAACAAAMTALRISDELRFRRAINGIERQERPDGAIVIERSTAGGKAAGRNTPERRRRDRAQAFLDAKRGGRAR